MLAGSVVSAPHNQQPKHLHIHVNLIGRETNFLWEITLRECQITKVCQTCAFDLFEEIKCSLQIA